MKVYVLITRGGIPDMPSISGIYETQAQAEAAGKRSGFNVLDYDIEEHDLLGEEP